VTSTTTNNMEQCKVVTFLGHVDKLITFDKFISLIHSVRCSSHSYSIDFFAVSHQRKFELTLLVAPSLIFPVDGAVDLTNFSSDNG
jgi:hypothetical protein